MDKEFDATTAGVSEDGKQHEEEAPSLLTDRTAMMESIIENNDEATGKYAEDMGVDDPGDGDDLPGDDAGEKPEEEPEEKPPEEEPEMVKVIVDGEEKEVLLSDVMDAGKRTYQKESAADKRLEEATRLLKEAKEQAVTSESGAETDLPDETPELMTPKEMAEAMQYGTAEEAAQAIEQLNSQGRSREDAVTPEKIQEIAKKAVEDTNNSEKIAHKFNSPVDKGGFNDLTDDPYLRNMVIEKVNERLKAKEPNTWETYEKAGSEVREWVTGLAGGKTEDPFAGKKNKKKTIDNVQAAGAVKGNVDSKTKGQSASDIIAELGASRPGR